MVVTFFPGVVALQLLSEAKADANNIFDLRASEYSNSAFLFAASLRIHESFRNTVQSVCRMYTFSLLIIIQLA